MVAADAKGNYLRREQLKIIGTGCAKPASISKYCAGRRMMVRRSGGKRICGCGYKICRECGGGLSHVVQ